MQGIMIDVPGGSGRSGIWPSNGDASEWLFFFDESGDGKLYRTDPTWDVLGLAGIVVRRTYYFERLVPRWRTFVSELFGNPDVVLHTSEIRAKRDAFARLNERSANERFINRFNTLYASLQFTVIGVVVLKEPYRLIAAPGETDVYGRTVNAALWLLVHFLRRNGGRSNVVGEPRSPKDDTRVQRAYQSAYVDGLHDIPAAELQRLLPPVISWREKALNDPGLQLADLSAYPLARRAYRWPDAYPAYEHVIAKIYDGGLAKEHALGYRIVPEPPPGFRFRL